MRRNDPTKSSHRARPLTRRQEVLFIASAFVVGVVLQMLVLLHLGSILQSGLAHFIATIV
jgi:hypothetical protein